MLTLFTIFKGGLDPMKYVDLAGRRISALTLGTVQLGLAYGIANRGGKPSEETAFAILDAAVAGGVNAFDTAAGYGDAEEVLGRYFASRRAMLPDPFLVTKCKLDPALGSDRAAIEKQLCSSVEQSLTRLGIKRIPLLMLHNAQDMSQYGPVVPDTLRRLRDDGLIETAGVSVYHGREAEEMLRHDIYGAIQAPMNVFDLRLSRSGILPRLREAGKSVFVRSVFLQGFFFVDPARLPERYAPATGHLRPLRELAERQGISVAQLALSCIRDLPGITSLVLGAETPQQVSENIGLLEGPGLTPEAAAELEALSVKVPIDFIMDTVLLGK